jgi:serine/threonine protein kinase
MSCCTACATQLPELAVFCPRCGRANEPDFDRLLARKLGDRYQIYRRLGEGGLSTVFVATDTRADDIVVVKVSDPRLLVRYASGTRAEAAEARDYWSEMIERMRREVEALADLKHPHIVRVLATGAITEELRYVVMEFLRGRTLREEMNARRRFDFTEAARVGAEVATGLSAVHARGIVHRDLTPRNIFLCEESSEFGVRSSELNSVAGPEPRTVKVIDFGIAKFPQPPGAQPFTQHAVMCGTLGYASPEQCQNLPLDHRADIYSLGVVLYEMVTGQRPFTGRTATEVALKQMQGGPARPREVVPSLPLRLEALILRALARDPQARQQSAEEVAEELRAIATRIVVPLAESAASSPASAGAGGAPIKPIIVPLSASAAALAGGDPVGDYRALIEGASEEKAAPVETERDVFPSQAEQVKVVRQRRRRVALATAAVVVLFAAAGWLVASPWLGGRQAQPGEVAAQSSPSPSAEAQQAALKLEGDAGHDLDAGRGSNDLSSGLPSHRPAPPVMDAARQGSAPSRSEAAADSPSTAKARTASKASGSKTPDRRDSSPTPGKTSSARPATSEARTVGQPTDDSILSPTIAASRLPEPSGSPEPAPPQPKPADSPAESPSEVAAGTGRDDSRGDGRRSDDWRRERNDDWRSPRREPPPAEQELEPKLYSWRGEVTRERQVTLEMPGQPGTIDIPRDYRKRVGIVEPPSPSNGWRRAVLRIFGDGLVKVIVRWYPNRKQSDPRHLWSRRNGNSD